MKDNMVCALNTWAFFREEYIRDPLVSVVMLCCYSVSLSGLSPTHCWLSRSTGLYGNALGSTAFTFGLPSLIYSHDLVAVTFLRSLMHINEYNMPPLPRQGWPSQRCQLYILPNFFKFGPQRGYSLDPPPPLRQKKKR